MEGLLNEVLQFVESDSQWWEDAARQCDDLARNLPTAEKAKWGLLCAVYRERAKAHRDLIAKIRQESGA